MLGRFHNDFLEASGVDLIYLFSVFRPQTGDVEDVVKHMKEIENTSRQKIKYLLNSSNLAGDTTLKDIEDSKNFAMHLSAVTGIPLLGTLTVEDSKKEGYIKVKRYVKLPWEREA